MKKTFLFMISWIIAGIMLSGCSRNTEPVVPDASMPVESTPSYVTIEGGPEAMQVPKTAETLELTCAEQIDHLIAKADELPQITEIKIAQWIPTAAQVLQLEAAFPDSTIDVDQIELNGEQCDADITWIDLSDLKTEEIQELGQALPVFKSLKDVSLVPEGEMASVTLDDALALYEYCPHLRYHYVTELFGQVLSTDMEQIEYFRVSIGDEGLKEFRKLLPMMYQLSYFKLDWCGTSDEAMAALRDEYADKFPVVWRIFFGKYNSLTDTYRIWANGVTSPQSEVLKYCTQVRYMDLGHSPGLENIDFTAYMPELQVAIFGDCKNVSSLAPLENCSKLEYLEIFSTAVTDLSPLEKLVGLEHLNISRVAAADLSPLMKLSNLKRLWSNANPDVEDQVEAYKQMYPDCEVTTKGGNSVSYLWRYTDASRTYYAPRYALLRAQIGYGRGEMSAYPRGYLREEITYESAGLSPVDGLRKTG